MSTSSVWVNRHSPSEAIGSTVVPEQSLSSSCMHVLGLAFAANYSQGAPFGRPKPRSSRNCCLEYNTATSKNVKGPSTRMLGPDLRRITYEVSSTPGCRCHRVPRRITLASRARRRRFRSSCLNKDLMELILLPGEVNALSWSVPRICFAVTVRANS